MSHIATYTTTMTSLKTIEEACVRLGLTFLRNQKTAQFYQGQHAACVHAIGIPGSSYQVGLVRNADKTYTFLMDTYDATLRNTMGPNGQRFLQHYAAAGAIAEVKQHRRMHITETALKNGNIRLQFVAR